MKMLTHAANDMREITKFINANNIPKEHIVNIFQSNDGTFMVVYFSEE